jgi:predicted N-acetyltransferase YhbS
MQEGQRLGALVVPETDASGAAVWSIPNASEIALQSELEKKAFLRRLLGKRGFENYQSIITFMSTRAGESVPENSWYLSILGVSPKLQGRGLGSTLIKPTLKKADELEVPCYLETFSARNIQFYNRFGFSEVASHVEPITNSRYWIMLREPR